MSNPIRRLRHFFHRVVVQQVHLAERFGHFTERHFFQQVHLAEDFGRFNQELFKKSVQEGERFGHRALFYSVREMPYVTAVAALVVNIIPILGQIISLLIVAISTIVERYAAELNARINLGMPAHEARQYARKMEHRTLTYGGIAAAIGGLAAGIAAVASAATVGADAGQVSLMAGEGVESTAGAGEGAAQGFAAGVVQETATSSSGGGFLGSLWSTVTASPGATLGALGSIYGVVSKILAPAPSPQGPQVVFEGPGPSSGMGGGGSGGGASADGGGGFGYDPVGADGRISVDFWLMLAGGVFLLLAVFLLLR